MDFYSSKLVQCLLVTVVFLLTACGNSSGVPSGGSIASSSGTAASSQSVAFSILNTAPVVSCSQGGVTVNSGIDVNANGVLDASEITNTQFICNGVAGTVGASGINGINGLTALVSVTTEPPGANCATGGKKINSGLNTNGNGILDSTEITSSSYICNGATGATGTSGTTGTTGASGVSGANGLNTLLVSIAEPVGANCTYGGTKVTSGFDNNGNGILDSGEITSIAYICNGANGSNGANGNTGATGTNGATGTTGTNGANGLNALVAIAAEPVGVYCTYGGIKITSGLDTNANEQLDPSEVSSTTYVCKGASVAFTILNTAPVASCPQGGVTVESGLDVNSNGVLDASEITNTQFICNGVAGASGTSGINGLTDLVSFTIEPPGANCATGGKKVNSGLDTNGNGILDSTEITSSSYICNGATGAAGNNGSNGANGNTGDTGTTGASGVAGTPGANGLNTLVAIVAEPVGSNCTYGGTEVTSGIDSNGNGILDSGEVTSTRYICNGATGAAGANAIINYAEFYALMPGDNSGTVAVGADVEFPQDGPAFGGKIVRTGTSAFTLQAIGTYQIMFQVSVDEAGQLELTLNGAVLPYTVTGRATGTSQIVGISLVQTSAINSTLTVRNPAGNSTALTITPLAGGASAVSADLVITQLN